jgi:hypothetical protein
VFHVDSVRGADKYECSVIRSRPIRKPKAVIRRVVCRSPRPRKFSCTHSPRMESSTGDSEDDGEVDSLTTSLALPIPPPLLGARDSSLKEAENGPTICSRN